MRAGDVIITQAVWMVFIFGAIWWTPNADDIEAQAIYLFSAYTSE